MTQPTVSSTEGQQLVNSYEWTLGDMMYQQFNTQFKWEFSEREPQNWLFDDFTEMTRVQWQQQIIPTTNHNVGLQLLHIQGSYHPHCVWQSHKICDLTLFFYTEVSASFHQLTVHYLVHYLITISHPLQTLSFLLYYLILILFLYY